MVLDAVRRKSWVNTPHCDNCTAVAVGVWKAPGRWRLRQGKPMPAEGIPCPEKTRAGELRRLLVDLEGRTESSYEKKQFDPICR